MVLFWFCYSAFFSLESSLITFPLRQFCRGLDVVQDVFDGSSGEKRATTGLTQAEAQKFPRYAVKLLVYDHFSVCIGIVLLSMRYCF